MCLAALDGLGPARLGGAVRALLVIPVFLVLGATMLLTRAFLSVGLGFPLFGGHF
jgi:hypothetical protein